MTTRAALLTLTALILAVAGCSTNTELGGVEIPNARPDTRITGQPPTLLEAGFTVSFHWTGSDPDGRVAGFQWKISDNGTDGITPRDTLTVDPLTGAVLNPWRFTTATDTTFVVLADAPDFPSDGPNSPRSFRTHSLFVRTVDDKGAVDADPDFISFTSTTIVPTCRAAFPGLMGTEASRVPPTVNMGWEGEDSDFELRVPTRVRYLWRPAIASDGTIIQVPSQLTDARKAELLGFDSPEWSPWERYKPDAADRIASFTDQIVGDYFLFAVQVQDTAGAVSIGQRYAVEVANLVIVETVRPRITLQDPFLGPILSSYAFFPIAAGQPLNFSWAVDPSNYNGKIVSMRHGWDLKSVDDIADPGWSVPPGLAEQNRFAVEQTFQEGIHTFWLLIEDDSGIKTVRKVEIEVVPYVDYNLQRPLLVLDQLHDDNVQNWLDEQGIPRNQEGFRNEFWQFLESGPGGVVGLDWNLDRMDHRDAVNYADLVGYKVVLCYARSNDAQTMFRQFRPVNSVDKFVWLTSYQIRGGNLFLVGENSMDSFLERSFDPYMTPVIFDTAEESFPAGTRSYILGFGTKELTDGTEVLRGPLQYPYAVAGISALDWTSPSTKYIFARPQSTIKDQRENACVGLKGVYLDPAYKDEHSVPPGAVSDSIYTNTTIDWFDTRLIEQARLSIVHNNFQWRDDEFVDANIAGRGTPSPPQECSGEEFEGVNAPGGMCVEPMFRGIARFDWLREWYWSTPPAEGGDPDWPPYSSDALEDTCGLLALRSYVRESDGLVLNRGSAQTNTRVFGYYSYKMARDKPSAAPDVYWGFDPYRFDHEKIKKAIRWVLRSNFTLDVEN